jgi:hypothetical protein
VNVLTHSGDGGYLKAVIWDGANGIPVEEMTIQVDGQGPLTFRSVSQHFATTQSTTVSSPYLRRLPIGEGIRFQNSLSIEVTNPGPGITADVTVVWGVDI